MENKTVEEIKVTTANENQTILQKLGNFKNRLFGRGQKTAQTESNKKCPLSTTQKVVLGTVVLTGAVYAGTARFRYLKRN